MTTDRPRILAIDDTPANLMVLTNALAHEFSFQLASSGAQGISFATENPPDLILLDVMMPGMDGYETCRRLKALPALAETPVIFITALTDMGSEVSGLELGAADYLHKPISVAIARQRIRNLVDREKLRRERDAYRDHLEEQVARRTSEYLAAKDEAEIANRVKSVFLANMSHELRTPLNAILGMNALLDNQIKDPGQKDKCRKVRDASRHLLAMIEDILQVSRMEADLVEAGQVGFSLPGMVATTAAPFRLHAEAKGIAVATSVDPALPDELCGTPTRIKQALEHLLSNAVKFSDSGTITLRVQRESGAGDSFQVRFEVEDQGIGIAPDHFKRLFHAFSQVDGSTTRKYGGTGIGLAIAKHLALTMNGTIGLDSTPGRGSRFWITVPLCRNSGQCEKLPAAEEAAGVPAGPAPVSAPPPPINPDAVTPVLRSLLVLLDDAEIRSIRVWEENRSLLEPLLAARADTFRNAIEDYDFDRARGLLSTAIAGYPELAAVH